MIIAYPSFFRRFGVRKLTQLSSPPMPHSTSLGLPRNSIFHYIGTGPLDDGPTEEENILQNINRGMWIQTVGELTGHEGNPRKLPVNVDKIARQHRLHHPRFRPLRGLESAARDQTMPVVYNYSYLLRMYRYSRNYYQNYYQHKNVLDTVFTTLSGVITQTDRHQFIQFNLPKTLPSLSMLLGAERHLSTRLAVAFSTIESLAILQMWTWLGTNRKSCALGKIPDKYLDRINLIFTDSNRWIMVNLGLLNQWRTPTQEEVDEDPSRTHGGFLPLQMQKRFLRLMMALMDARSTAVPENLGDEDKPIDAETQPQPVIVDSTKPAEQLVKDHIGYEAPQATEKRVAQTHEELLSMHSMDQLDQDIAALERLNERVQQETQQFIENIPDVEVPADASLTHEEALNSRADTLAEEGAISASEYKRLLDAISNYKNLLAPDGTQFDHYIKVPPEVTAITTVPTVTDNLVVTDKSMLQSTLLEFDQKYVEEVMPKDIASMVGNLQQAGILILSYKVETIEDITGSYEAFEVKVKPLQGTTSILRFKIPKVRPDGTYVINGVEYRSRKQRGDLPLRKIRPNRVALTSYYGKTFVDRDEKKVNDYGRWLTDNLMAIGLDPQDSRITDLLPGNVFHSDLTDTPQPRLYTTIAMNFRGFNLRVGNDYWSMCFDLTQRDKLMPGLELKGLEANGCLVVGVCGQRVMVMDAMGGLYAAPSKDALQESFTALPSFEEILGLSQLKAPIDFSTLNVSGKPIPVGVVLGYLMGLDRLIKRLRVNYRIVPTGQRAQLQDDEWSISFQDETWVFNRDNALATLVLAGWRDFEDATRNYNAHEYNRKDVYFNTLDSQGYGVRFLREIDLMNQLFIDPISRDLLRSMNEPIVFTELVLKCAQYLTHDNHPHELDAAHMRVKGYERFAGFVYSELVKSVRMHNARSNKSMYPLELNPYAVWFAICEDPAKNQNVQINPIQNLKEQEALTYSGTGGRSGRTMVKRMRAYHKSDRGTVSEATMDSSDVGINMFLSANPQFNSLRGTTDPYRPSTTSTTSLVSTSLLLAPAGSQDA